MKFSKTEILAIVIAMIINLAPMGLIAYIGYEFLTSPVPTKLGKKFNNWLDEK